ncbi:acetyltransferase (GNAT) family protein [Lentzea atacamensis]|uniref:Acetyltransferase (GNAT) family protein n=1 Tax=Lentzea atacamensis TaxID=531938 RepID=A0A316HK65_9PSEU|nr:GNAT family N-acetyltransferase [Lentzea atacamensis]PWK80677.1 acetyltransferase (GNAT) family protein [Lentzea atacamensis]
MTGSINVAPFELDQASRLDLEACYELWMAARAMDRPEDDVAYSYDDWLAAARQPAAGLGARGLWLARRDDEVVAMVVVFFLEAENSDVALTEITVAPNARRQGVGTAVLRAVLQQFEARGRGVVEGWDLTAAGPAHRWAESVGLREVKTTVAQWLRFADADLAAWEVPVPAGYRLRSWVGAAPEELVASYTRALSALRDAPSEESAVHYPEWTVDRMRSAEEEARDRGVERRVVVAVSEETGEVAAVTRLDLYSSVPTCGYQLDTVVVPSQRGNGLGLCVKAALIRLLRAERPEVDRVYTTANADNEHIIAINHRIGFRIERTTVAVKADTARLRAVLGS